MAGIILLFSVTDDISCSLFQLPSWSRSDWKVCGWVGGGGGIQVATVSNLNDSCLGLSWVELALGFDNFPIFIQE